MSTPTPPNTPPNTPAPIVPATSGTTDKTPVPSGEPKKFAGKYATEADLTKGISEARKTLGLKGDIQYGSIEEAERAYGDFDALINSRKKPDAPTALEIKPGEPELSDDLDIDGVLAKAGLKGDELAQAYVENKRLSDEQYAALKKQGYPKKVVDAMIGSQVAIMSTRVEKATEAAIKIAGGEEQHEQLRVWAATKMPPAWLNDYAARIKTNPEAYTEMIEVIAARHSRENGGGGNSIIQGGAHSGPSSVGFKTNLEMRNAIAESNRKYGDWSKDSALMQRIKNTPAHIQKAIT